MAKDYYVYILASRPGGALYVGVTNDLGRRCLEHKTGAAGGFTIAYGVTRLVYYEWFTDINAAIAREKVLKRWRRAWKLRLIESANPIWKDLHDEETGGVDQLPGTVFQAGGDAQHVSPGSRTGSTVER